MFKSSVVLLLSIASAAAFAPAALAPGLQAKRVRSVSLFAPATSLEPKCPPPEPAAEMTPRREAVQHLSEFYLFLSAHELTCLLVFVCAVWRQLPLAARRSTTNVATSLNMEDT